MRDPAARRSGSRPGSPRTKPVTVFVDTGFFTTVGDRSLLGDMIRQAGGTNVAGASPETGPFDLGRSRKLDPDVYLATSDSGTTLAELRREPGDAEARGGQEPAASASCRSGSSQPGPRVGDGARRGRAAPPSGCVSLTSTR